MPINITASRERRLFLNESAKVHLSSTNTEPTIDPHKIALHKPQELPLVKIQVQKTYRKKIIKQSSTLNRQKQQAQLNHIQQANTEVTQVVLEDLNVLNDDLFNTLKAQLQALEITKIQEKAKEIILRYPHVFMDGIILSQLPSGFYVDKGNKTLCYTAAKHKISPALTPILFDLSPTDNPSEALLMADPAWQKDALSKALLPFKYDKEVMAILDLLTAKEGALEGAFILPLFTKIFAFAGENYTLLIARLLKAASLKGVSLKFISTPYFLDSLLDPKCIKNLQKLINLPKEQREWWNTLTEMHKSFHAESFDFNTYFEAYTQTFLAKIEDKHLTLPSPCPIKHNGHMLITLNRVLDVLETATNTKEQCLNLNELDWSALGVHFAMTQCNNPINQATAKMEIHGPDDLKTDPNDIYLSLNHEDCKLKPWLYRFMGQHWRKNINIQSIEAQLNTINTQTLSLTQKNKLIFILTTSFAHGEIQSASIWQQTLKDIISLLVQVNNEDDENTILNFLSQAFLFKPAPSLLRVSNLLELCLKLKENNPDKSFADITIPLTSFLQNDGDEFLTRLQESIQKNTASNILEQKNSITIYNFIASLHQQREILKATFLNPQQYSNIIKLLTSINTETLALDDLIEAFNALKEKKGELYFNALINTLGQININKSKKLPNIEQIKNLIQTLTEDESIVSQEYDSSEQQPYLQDVITSKKLLPDTVLGQGNISEIGDIIVEAFVDSLHKNGGTQLNFKQIKAALEKQLNTTLLGQRIVSEELKTKITLYLYPLLDALGDLIAALTNNPQFDGIIEALKRFEDAKMNLIEAQYHLSVLGTSKGSCILSLLLTGKKYRDDNNITGIWLTTALTRAHEEIRKETEKYFAKPSTPKTDGFNYESVMLYFEQFSKTLSPMFIFKAELVERKVLPILQKTISQLNLDDPDFIAQTIKDAGDIEENISCDIALRNYKNKIESMKAYLNLLIKLRKKDNFCVIYEKLKDPQLRRLSYEQKLLFINLILTKAPQEFEHFTDLTIEALSNQPNADVKAIQRVLDGIPALFTANLDTARDTFFKMSLAHNLKSEISFPLTELNQLKSSLSEDISLPIITEIIQLLGRAHDNSAIELIKNLIQETHAILLVDAKNSNLCLSLLKIISSADISKYLGILSSLQRLDPSNRKDLAIILVGLATNTKDDNVDLSRLYDITQGLARRPNDIAKVAGLFASPPYPKILTLNPTLAGHGSQDLHDYCDKFDLDPFAEPNKSRQLEKQFSDEYIGNAITKLEDLMHQNLNLESLKQTLTQELIYINNVSYINPLSPPNSRDDFYEDDKKTPKLQKLTKASRAELRQKANGLLLALRENTIQQDKKHLTKLQLLAYLREIYFRTTGKFLNSTQMLIILLAQHVPPEDDLLMRIKTGEGKSLITPFTAIFQWIQGGTVNIYTANSILATQGYENSYKTFFDFFFTQTGTKLIPSTLITNDSHPENYQQNGINCSTLDDFNGLLLEAEEAQEEHLILNGEAIHANIDECDDAFFDKIDLTKLVAQNDDESSTIWVDELAYAFTKLKNYRNIDNDTENKPWDTEEDVDQFRSYLMKQTNDNEKQVFIVSLTRPQLRQYIQASCQAQKYIENKHFVIQPIKEKDAAGNEITKLLLCVPLHQSIPRQGSIFTDSVQQALCVRLKIERKDIANLFEMKTDPVVLASRSAQNLINFHHKTGGHVVGISGTVGELAELKSLSSTLKTQAFGFAPHYGDTRKDLEPIFTYSAEETDEAIQEVIKKIQKPIIIPTITIIDPSVTETTDGKQQFIQQVEAEIAKTAMTQTRPILIINEDFDEAKKRSKKLEQALFAKDRKNIIEGHDYKLQVIDGRETVSELDKKLRNAGKCKCITNSTAMLGRGIDIDIGEHPDGLLVIQTFITGSRMTDQFKGRAARNGKKGQWQAVYQIEKPTHWLQKILHFLFPIYRKRYNAKKVAGIQAKLKEKAAIEKIYNQAIDNIQNTLMQHVRAWDDILRASFPQDENLNAELYNWREFLFKEISKTQDPSPLSQNILQSRIDKFKLDVSKIWEDLKENKWARKVSDAKHLSREQNLRIKYLKALSFTEDLKTQERLKETSEPLKTSIAKAENESINQTIINKAGAELKFAQNSADEKTKLELAERKQLLPHFLAQFCLAHPDAIKELNISNNDNKNKLLEVIITVLDKITPKDKKQSLSAAELIANYQTFLADIDINTLGDFYKKLKIAVNKYTENSEKQSLQEQFRNKQLMLTFAKLYQTVDPELKKIVTSYNEELVKHLAQYLTAEFEWAIKKPSTPDAWLEREVARRAAEDLYKSASEVFADPTNITKSQELYQLLQNKRAELHDKFLFSIGHNCPRDIINTTLKAIDNFNVIPACDTVFRNKAHDNAIIKKHIFEFRSILANVIPEFAKTEESLTQAQTTHWDGFITSLVNIYNHDTNSSDVFIELAETIKRFKINAPQNFHKPLERLLENVNYSITQLSMPNVLHEDLTISFLKKQKNQFAKLFNLKPEQVRLKCSNDGVQDYIDVQLENAKEIQDFTVPKQQESVKILDEEEKDLEKQLALLESHKVTLQDLKQQFVLDSRLNLSLTNNTDLDLATKSQEIVGPTNIPDQNLATKSQEIEIGAKSVFDSSDLKDIEIINSLKKITNDYIKAEGLLAELPENMKQICQSLSDLHKPYWKELISSNLILPKVYNELWESIGNDLEKIEKHKAQIISIEKEKTETDIKNNTMRQELDNAIKKGEELEREQKTVPVLSIRTLSIKLEIRSTQNTIDELIAQISLATNKLTDIEKEQTINNTSITGINKTIATTISTIKEHCNEHIKTLSDNLIEKVSKSLRDSSETVKKLQYKERQKTFFQTKRFANVSELIQYENNYKAPFSL